MVISGKRYKIKSRSRFTFFVAIAIVFSVMVTNTFLGLNNVSGLTDQEYIQVEVKYGDTLWDMAKVYMSDTQDIRRAVYTLRQLNGIAAHELRPGQIILIPVD